jgi:hypothetical protein
MPCCSRGFVCYVHAFQLARVSAYVLLGCLVATFDNRGIAIEIQRAKLLN